MNILDLLIALEAHNIAGPYRDGNRLVCFTNADPRFKDRLPPPPADLGLALNRLKGKLLPMVRTLRQSGLSLEIVKIAE